MTYRSKEEAANYKREWVSKNKEKYLAQRRRWSYRPAGILAGIRGRAKRRKVIFNLRSKEEFVNWFISQKQECYYCGIKKDNQGGRYKNLSIDRKDNSLPYQIDNIVLCCFRCNTIKGSFFTEQEMLEIAAKYIRPKVG